MHHTHQSRSGRFAPFEPSTTPVASTTCYPAWLSSTTRKASFTALLVVWFSFHVCSVFAAGLDEQFLSNPLERNWRQLGDTNLFSWDPKSQRLKATWDSSKRTSAIYSPLETIVTTGDNFSLQFDLVLNSVVIGTDPAKPSTFQLAFGLFNTRDIVSSNFVRAAGIASNLAEFDYFPDSGFGATISPTMISSNNEFASGFDFPLEMGTNRLFKVVMVYTSTNRTLTTTITRDGLPFGPLKPVTLTTNFTDLRLNAVGVISYSDAVLTPSPFDGSILASGTFSRIKAELPPNPVANLSISRTTTPTLRKISFTGLPGWNYRVMASPDLRQWSSVSNVLTVNSPGDIQFTQPESGSIMFYCVSSERQ